MARSRNPVLIRFLTLLLLLWVGFDIGAHGLLASDFGSWASTRPAARANSAESRTDSAAAPDHCFCHGISLGAVLPGLAVCLASAGAVSPVLASQVPTGGGQSVDHPPQLAA